MVQVTWHEQPREDATASTIAMYKRERSVHPGCLVAVNANYTCYAIRGKAATAAAAAASPRPAPLA